MSEERLKSLASRLPPDDRKLVFEFFEDKSLNITTRTNYLNTLVPFLTYAKLPLKKIRKIHVQTWLVKERERKISPGSITAYQTHLKSFFRWLNGGKTPPAVVWIKIKRLLKQFPPDQLITPDDVKKMVDVADHPRDRALISFLHDSAARIGEAAALKIKHITFDQYGAVVVIPSGKTGMRRIRINTSVSYLSAWLNVHPKRENPEAPLWIGPKGGIKESRVRGMLGEYKKKAAIKKPCNPHAFRHARLTEMARFLSEAELRIYAGWGPSSTMPAVYIHLSGKDLDASLLNHWGFKPEEEEKEVSPLEAVKCPRCHERNPPGALFCFKCSMALTLLAAVEAEKKREHTDKLMGELLEDLEVKQLLLKKLGQISKKAK